MPSTPGRLSFSTWAFIPTGPVGTTINRSASPPLIRTTGSGRGTMPSRWTIWRSFWLLTRLSFARVPRRSMTQPLTSPCYNKIFARDFPRVRFVSVGPASKVHKRIADLLPLLDRIVGGASIVRFLDRDSLTCEEIREKRAQGLRVMSGYRNLDSMLLSDGLLARLCASVGKHECLETIVAARDDALARAHGSHAADDLKPAAQAVHHAARADLELSRSGESKEGFMRAWLAPLVTPGTPEYEGLKRDIFG